MIGIYKIVRGMEKLKKGIIFTLLSNVRIAEHQEKKEQHV